MREPSRTAAAAAAEKPEEPERLTTPAFEPSIAASWIAVWKLLARRCNTTATEKGWWEKDPEDGHVRTFPESLALMHSELSEALEAFRLRNPPSDHIQFSGIEEELADVVIRIMDTAEHFHYNVAAAIIAKMQYNKSRPYRHAAEGVPKRL